MDAQYFGDPDAQLFRLDQRLDEGVQFLDTRAAAHIIERLEPRTAEPDLVEHLGELVGQRVVEFLDQAADRGIEAEARLNRDRQQVERVR